ncbi:condensation domain-containing protein [Tenacibaculum halocynthiae]|uniref:condensation domain-containing protein n=1 Tax=Tenacibaculum halocynthiae TaxID=1254437 RepID=UPI003894FD9B
MELKGQTIQEIFLKNINSKKESGITFIEGSGDVQYLSYKKLYLEASYKLYALQERGIKPGNEVVFQFQSNKNLIITFWACVLGNFIPVPIVLGTTSDIISKIIGVWRKLKNPYIITDFSSLKTIIKDYGQEKNLKINNVISKYISYDELAYTQKASSVPGESSDIVFIQFSSGSTGNPKGVINTQESIIYNINLSLKMCDIQESDRFLGWMPLTHDMGLVFFHLLPLLGNVSQFLMPSMLFLSNPEIWLENLSKQKITISGSPNFGYVHVLENIKKEKLEELSFDTIKLMANGAEPVSIEVCRKLVEILKPYGFKEKCMTPGYGLAEAVLIVSLCNKENGFKEFFLNRNKLKIGNKVEFKESKSANTSSFADLGAFEGTEIKIINEKEECLSDDTLGIIQLKSTAITSGYYNDQEMTDKLISKSGWFNTGDIGFTHKGHLIITGREKEMIIINGQNYFPNDIDNVIEELASIKFQQAISCNVFNNEKYKDELFVFVNYIGEVEDFLVISDAIKKIISERIGLVVKKVIAVKKIPRTTSGKIQRYVLRERYINGDYNEFIKVFFKYENNLKKDSYVVPKTEVEKKLANIWKDYFGIDEVGVTDNFFYLGGSSIGLGVLVSKIQEKFGVHIDIRELFIAIDFKDQVKLIENSFIRPIEEIKVSTKKSYYPISKIQKRLFVNYQMDSLSIAYNTPVVLSFNDQIDVQLCENIFKKIIERHEILRTSFHVYNNELIQKVHDTVNFSIQNIEMVEEGFDKLLKKCIKPFNLEEPLLFRVFFLEKQNKLILDIHHIVSDGASFDILFKEFYALYKMEELPQLKLQYKDFSEWHKKFTLGVEFNNQKEFWLNQFEDMPEPLSLPYDFQKMKSSVAYNDTLSIVIDGERRKKLIEVSKEKRVTMFTLLLTVYYSFLYKITYQEDIVIGSSTTGRWYKDMENIMGVFTNLLALRNFPKGDISFSSFLKEVNENVLDCLSKQEYTYGNLVDDLELKPTQSNSPLFNIMFEYYAFDWSKLKKQDTIFSKIEYPSIESKFDLTIKIVEEDNRHIFLFDYNTDLFIKDSIERFASYFIRIIDNISDDAELLLKDIEILSDTEKTKILTEFNSASIL